MQKPIIEILLIENILNNDFVILAGSIKDKHIYIYSNVTDEIKKIDLFGKFYLEFGCGISKKIQFLDKFGEIKLITISQNLENRNLIIWDLEFM